MLGQAEHSTLTHDGYVRIENEEQTVGATVVVTVASDLGNSRCAAQRWADAGLRVRGKRQVVFDMRELNGVPVLAQVCEDTETAVRILSEKEPS